MKHMVLALLPVMALAEAGEASATSLRWFGHASFEIVADGGARVVIDPFDARVGYAVPSVTADLVLITHEHGDHSNAAAVNGNPEVLHGLGMDAAPRTVKGVSARAVRTKHFGDPSGAGRGENTVFVLKVDGMNIVHCGDLGHTLSAAQVKAIGPVDVLMLPVGGFYTIDGAAAARVVGQLKPKLVVPMHYKTAANPGSPVAGAEAFLEAAKKAGWEVREPKSATLKLTRATLPKKTTVVVLEFR
ncbi:MAG: MBL fold metallo-hydrolase [Armatimonadetes bacterium]|nr:MBL fold metallo-hydrolase [Armatimonadota bacterium]